MSSFRAFSVEKSIFIGKGEQRSLKIKDLEHYSLGNPEVLSKRLRYKKGKLLIKGKTVGFSDLIIWKRNRKKETYHIYVLSKKESLKLAQASSVLEDLGLNLNFKGKILIVTGEVKSKQDLYEIAKLKKIFKNQIILKIDYSKKLRDQIVTEVYLEFSRLGLKKFHCQYQDEITCTYYAEKLDKKIEKKFSWSAVKFRHKEHIYSTRNLVFKLYFIQSQQSNGKAFSIGLDKLSSRIKHFITNGSLSLISDNSIKIGSHYFKLSTLAQPETKTLLNKETSVQIGLEIANQQLDPQKNVIGTQWKEVGFSFDYKVSLFKGKLKLEYSTKLSDQINGGISSTNFSGHQFIELGTVSELLKASVSSKKRTRSNLPFIENIPLINILSSSRAVQSADKLISIYYEVDLE